MKKVNLQDWEDSFMAQLACCLHNYSHDFYYALVGSSEPYDGLVLPWGSNPATDYLLSGGTMRLVHDGAGFSRTEKVAYIANNRTASRVLKVCWEGKETHKNCGVCEKCIRAQANFLAVGVAHPACFDAPFNPRHIRTIWLRNAAQCAELESIIAYATTKGMTGKWLKELQARVKAFKSPPRLRDLQSHSSLAVLSSVWHVSDLFKPTCSQAVDLYCRTRQGHRSEFIGRVKKMGLSS